MNIFLSTLWRDPTFFFMITVIVVFSICFHEYCHAQMALWMGDSTAAEEGHLTLNPLKQMGVMSIVMFLIIGIAWGAVPVNPEKLRSKYKWGALATSAAGPVGNLLLALIAWLCLGFFAVHHDILPKQRFDGINLLLVFMWLGVYNIVLLLFNLIPAPGLDGWNIVSSLFPQILKIKSEVARGIMIFLIVIAMMGINQLMRFAVWVMQQAPRPFL